MLVVKWLVVSSPVQDSDTPPPLGCGGGSLEETQRENSELGLTVIITCAMLLVVLMYYVLVDPWIGPRASVSAAVRRVQLMRSAGSGFLHSRGGSEGEGTRSAPSGYV